MYEQNENLFVVHLIVKFFLLISEVLIHPVFISLKTVFLSNHYLKSNQNEKF